MGGCDGNTFFAAVANRQGHDGGLETQDVKDLLKAMLWLDSAGIDNLVDRRWFEACGHRGVADAKELLRLFRLAGSAAGQAAVALEPPLISDEVGAWFDFWAAEA